DPEDWILQHLCSSVKSRDRQRSERESDRPPPLQGTRSTGLYPRCAGGQVIAPALAPHLALGLGSAQVRGEAASTDLLVQLGNGAVQTLEHLAAAADLGHQGLEVPPQVHREQHETGQRAEHQHRPDHEPQHHAQPTGGSSAASPAARSSPASSSPASSSPAAAYAANAASARSAIPAATSGGASARTSSPRPSTRWCSQARSTTARSTAKLPSP